MEGLPILILIGTYERYFAVGMRFAETRREAAQTFFNSLPRHIKHMPLVEALVGPSSNDVYDAIFDVDVSSELDPFEESDDEFPILRSFHSRENVEGAPAVPETPRHRRAPSTMGAMSARESPRPKLNLSLPSAGPLSSVDGQVSDNIRSPLAMLFGSRMPSADGHAAVARAEAVVRRVENMMEDIQLLPVQKLKDEMKDLQVRSNLYLFYAKV
ncbi:hypothetical protein C0991_010659 [Blastosporella zonata]|nr:hypothetical protein C0991_010659 [Blastosporella zonata]